MNEYDSINDLRGYKEKVRKDTDDLIKRIDKIVLDTANDINEYLKDDKVPVECYVKDIDAKMNLMRKMIKTELDELYD